MNYSLNELPDGLPVPLDDGLAAHLEGLSLPNITLAVTNGTHVHLAELTGRVVIYIYPLTGQPELALPAGWDEIPGARGCTPQACDFSNHYQILNALNTLVYGLSSQATDYQFEFKNRLHLPFDLISDAAFQLKIALNLPTFQVDNVLLYKRLTLIIENNTIRKVFYPVFPPNKNAEQVIDWLQKHPSLCSSSTK